MIWSKILCRWLAVQLLFQGVLVSADPLSAPRYEALQSAQAGHGDTIAVSGRELAQAANSGDLAAVDRAWLAHYSTQGRLNWRSGNSATVSPENYIGTRRALLSGSAQQLVWRGSGQRMRFTEQGLNTTTARYLLFRTRHYSNAAFRKFRLVTPLTSPFQTAGTGYISNGTSGTAGNILTIVTCTAGSYAVGAQPTAGAPSGTQILAQLTNANAYGIPGREGTYQLTASVNVAYGTSGSPLSIPCGIADTLFPYAMTFQVAFEASYKNATTGIPAGRPLLTYNGATSFAYDPTTWVAHFTGTISSGVLTASSVTNTIRPGALVQADITGSGVPDLVIIGTQLSGTTGGAGTYSVALANGNACADVSSTSMTATLMEIVWDAQDAGTTISPGAFFGLWTTIQLPASAASQIPYHSLWSSYINRYEGSSFSTTVDGIGTQVASTATSISSVSNSQAGVTGPFSHAMMLLQVAPTAKTTVTLGDSIAYGVGEGVTGTSTYGDANGSALSNLSWVSRGLYEYAGVNEVNFGRGSDKGNYLSWSPQAWVARRRLMVLANPTSIVNQYVHNDLAGGTAYLGRANSTPYRAGVTIQYASSVYYVKTAGTSASSIPTIIASASGTTGVDIADGTVVLRLVTNSASTTATRTEYATVGTMMMINQAALAALGRSVNIVQANLLPYASATTNNYATLAGQTAGFTDNIFSSAIMALPADLKAVAVVDPQPYIAAGATDGSYNTSGVYSGKWATDGVTADLLTADGTHPNGHGHAAAAAAFSGLVGVL